MIQHTYHAYGKSFPVTEKDRVFVTTRTGEKVAQGLNHSRAWAAARAHASTQGKKTT